MDVSAVFVLVMSSIDAITGGCGATTVSWNLLVTVVALSVAVTVMVAVPILHYATFSVADTLVPVLETTMDVTSCVSLLDAVTNNWLSAVSGSVMTSGTVNGTLAVVLLGVMFAMLGG
jgi:hypothetical protein